MRNLSFPFDIHFVNVDFLAIVRARASTVDAVGAESYTVRGQRDYSSSKCGFYFFYAFHADVVYLKFLVLFVDCGDVDGVFVFTVLMYIGRMRIRMVLSC